MSRIDCISNRNIKIIATYLSNRIGNHHLLFEGTSYPSHRYASPDDFFLNEDEWTTHANFIKVLRKAKELSGDPYFYFFCGASAANLRTLGRLHFLARLFSGPSDGFRRIPFFSKNLTDSKDVEVIVPPAYDKGVGKFRTVLRIRHHSDIDVHDDYIGDPFSRGMISSIPTVWGLPAADVRQHLTPYDPVILLNSEPEFSPFGLAARVEGDYLTVQGPRQERRRIVGRKVRLVPESRNGEEVFLGRYEDISRSASGEKGEKPEAILIEETVNRDGRILLKQGEIFKAPYFILDVTYDRSSIAERLARLVRLRTDQEETETRMIETINQLRETIEARNAAYHELEKTNLELAEAKGRVDEYAKTLEEKVEQRTAELKRAKEELLLFSHELEDKVKEQVEELRRYNELRRYLSPRLADRILSTGAGLRSEPQRKMMTVLFSDIRNFSSFTESLEPEEIFHLLNKYLSEMTTLVHAYEGTLNKIIGDGMLIFFGDPVPMEDHARRAVQMAVEMQKKAAELKGEWLQYGHRFSIGIGINTGYMTVGNIGSEVHKDYTVIGNQVNVAARLVSLAGPGEILISQRTFSRVEGTIEADKMGDIQVKGILHPVVTYKVRGPFTSDFGPEEGDPKAHRS